MRLEVCANSDLKPVEHGSSTSWGHQSMIRLSGRAERLRCVGLGFIAEDAEDAEKFLTRRNGGTEVPEAESPRLASHPIRLRLNTEGAVSSNF